VPDGMHPAIRNPLTPARQCGRWRKEAGQVTDRALRYRANRCPPPGRPICGFGGSTRNVECGHLDGFEENTASKNLIWNCRACNTRLGVVFKRLGMGRRTRQYYPAQKGATSLGQWLTAVTSMKGQSQEMTVPAAVEMIRATQPARRSDFASEIWAKRRERGTDRPQALPF
jgi:hypothetical protein